MSAHRQLQQAHIPDPTIAAKFGYDGLDPNIQHQHTGIVRTAMHCHGCSKSFLAEVNHDVDGPIVLKCPHCGHKHYRRVDKGVVTEDRPKDQYDPVETFQEKTGVWKHDTVPAGTATNSEFLRHRWLNLMNRPKGR